MRPIQYQPPSYQEIPGIQGAVTIREFKGVNQFDPLSIADSFFTDVRNISTENYPAASVRKGYEVLGGAIGTRVLGLGVWKSTELHAVFNDGSWRRWNGTAWTTLKTGLNTNRRWSFTNFQGNWPNIRLVGSNGIDPIQYYDGVGLSDLENAPSNGDFITTYQNRLWCAVGQELHSCALDQPEEWELFNGDDEDSYQKTIESTAGDDIIMLSGGLNKLTIGMRHSIHELYGGVPSDFTTKLITEDVGVEHNHAVVTQDGSMRIMNEIGIYEYSGGVLPDKTFSDSVKDYLLGVSGNSTAGSDGHRLYFSVGTDLTLVYDPRPGIQGWSAYEISAVAFVKMGERFFIGDTNGRVLEFGNSARDDSQPISWIAITKPFNNSSVAQLQRWYKMWVVVTLPTGSTINVSLSPSVTGEDWELVQSVAGSGVRKQRIIIPVAKMANENHIRIKLDGTGPCTIHEITRQQRALPLY